MKIYAELGFVYFKNPYFSAFYLSFFPKKYVFFIFTFFLRFFQKKSNIFKQDIF